MFFRLASSCLSVSTALRRFLGHGYFFRPSVIASTVARRCGLDHLVELAFDLGLEIGLDLIDLGELGERPAAIGAEMVHAGHPVGLHRGFLLLRVLAPVALDLDHEMQQVIGAVTVIHQHDEVGQILPRLGAVAVRHFQAEVMVLGVGAHLRVRFGDAAEFAFPVAVEHDPVDVVLRRRPLVSQRSARDVLNRTWLVEPVGL